MNLAIALLATATLNAQTQIGNSGFESWDNVSGGQEPTNWNSFLTASGGATTFAANQMEASTDVRPGSIGTKSAKIWSRSVLGIIANGVFSTGRVNMGAASASSPDNYNYSVTNDANFSEALTERPDSIVFWAKFLPNGHNQKARLAAVIHDNYNYRDPQNAAAAPHVVGKAEVNFLSNGGTWQRISVPFNYTGPSQDPRFILVTFATNETPGGGAGNDQLWVDDLELVYVPKPSFTLSSPSICPGGTMTFTNTSEHYPTSYSWSFPGGSPATSTAANPTVTYAAAGTYNVTLTATNQWGSKTYTMTNAVTVNALDDATFNYSKPTYCTNVSNPVPTKVANGTFTATPNGLVFANASTGEIDLSASVANTYTITFTTNDVCTATSTKSVTLFQGSDASFNYPTNSICVYDVNPVPTVVTPSGAFSAEPTGLSFANATTGEIDLATSTGGTYVIKYIIGGACPDTVTRTVTLTDTPSATFSYAASGFCANAANPVPSFATGANGGVFSSTTGLSINSNTGEINLGASTPGTYVVTNNIAAVGSCPSADHSFTVTVKEVPNVTLTLTKDVICKTASPYMLAGGQPAGGVYSGTGITSNIVNPSVLQAGQTYTITYSYTNPTTQCSNSATDLLTVDDCASIEAVGTVEQLSVYPNPTNGVVTISNLNGNATFVAISVTGQVVAQGEISESSNKIDFSSIENGVYLLQIAQNEKFFTTRIVKH